VGAEMASKKYFRTNASYLTAEQSALLQRCFPRLISGLRSIPRVCEGKAKADPGGYEKNAAPMIGALPDTRCKHGGKRDAGERTVRGTRLES